ncbi:ketoacyl-synthetase C-terminal extension domain-containing protein [Kitasatospora sp. MAA4]|uniref:ketoacyl-synthetase C-terminal extension domain-containing protein n=1 Tax=Kitasatospora sp. MAA4 TaxID=3035093 RepID=UPI0024742285|nr:ketoacyl-synthetase C-terminal extension domain-containing protein [Kitasatospora sp. MAA4]
MSAAGIASLIKAALVVQRGVVPPQPGLERPSEALAGTRFNVARTAESWEDPRRRAAVSSFGFGGTNVHLVLEQTPVAAGPRQPRGLRPFVLSAGTPDLLAQYGRQLADLVQEQAPDLADLAYTLSTRAALPHQRTVHAEDHDSLVALLRGHRAAAPEAPPPLATPLTGTLLTIPVSPVTRTTHWGVRLEPDR